MVIITLTFTVETGNREIEPSDIIRAGVDFGRLEQTVFNIAMDVGRQFLTALLEGVDEELAARRDSLRFRDKGKRRTSIKTLLGVVEYERRVYRDKASPEEPVHVYLLDEFLDMRKIGQVSEGVCRILASLICGSTYRGTSDAISSMTGLDISHQRVWSIVQQLGERQQEQVMRHAELADAKQGLGTIETSLLYEENDGIWLKLQGKDREKFGASKEMKVGIAYDGVTWQTGKKSGKKRRTAHNKAAYACFDPAGSFRRKKEGIIASRFNVDAIDLRIINGDGAPWVQKQTGEDRIYVLDEFHRNRKILECIRDKEAAKVLRDYLYDGDVEGMFLCLDTYIDTLEDEKEISGAHELRNYLEENRDALLDPYLRGIEIPPTSEPGEVHHAQLGSMESNVFTLIGNRMKGRRFCWSVAGADHLALLLCLKHTTGFGHLFSELPVGPVAASDMETGSAVEGPPPLSSTKTPETEGKGYEYPFTMGLTGVPYWLRDLALHPGF